MSRIKEALINLVIKLLDINFLMGFCLLLLALAGIRYIDARIDRREAQEAIEDALFENRRLRGIDEFSRLCNESWCTNGGAMLILDKRWSCECIRTQE